MKIIKEFFIFLALLIGSTAVLAQPVTFTVNTTIGCGNTSFEGFDVTVNNCVLTLGCVHSFHSLNVINGGVVTHVQGDTVGLQLTVTTNATVDAASRIDVQGQGYAQGTGPGAGTGNSADAGGAGYGGVGGIGSINQWVGGPAYGSTAQPTQLGSGGGQGANNGGGSGGGYIRLIVNGILTLNGNINANGNNGFAPSWSGGGGSGGSIYLTLGTFAGSGTISSNGGNAGSWGSGGSGSGAGGRIAIYYTTKTFNGNIFAHSGIGWISADHGGAGTIYIKPSASNGNLTVENNNLIGQSTFASSITALDTVKIYKRSYLILQGATSYNYILVDSATLELNTAASANNVYIKTGATLTTSFGQLLQLSVSGGFTIDNGGAISINGKGYLPNNGPGAGTSSSDGGGGGYGGNGGNGQTGSILGGVGGYGSITAPMDFGSGGGQGLSNGGGAGGGAVRLIINGTLQNNGVITANGLNGFAPSWSGGGGAGGSIYITTGTLSGSGSIAANGGNGGTWNSLGSGGGGGGRIALYYTTNNFTGPVTACAGDGWDITSVTRGGAGTVFTKLAAQTFGDLVISNCTGLGAITLISGFPNGRIITVQNYSLVDWSGAITCATFTVSNSSEMRTANLQALDITASGNVSILTGCKLTADFRGYAAGAGPGAGSGDPDAGGGGYGGQGGIGCETTVGGTTYGSSTNPIDFGSGGGQGHSDGGGRGGGIVHLAVAGNLLFDGQISANGENGTHPNWSGGGGSGGSVYITAVSLGGNGLITANGGNGGSWGACGSGGGGGGRISLPACTDSSIANYVQVNGGAGGGGTSQPGQPGTIFRTVNSTDCDNNGLPDACEISGNPNLDCNHNGILDVCESFGAPTITIYSDSTQHLLLQWVCIPFATSYQIYRSATQPVLTIPGNLIGNTANTSFTDNAVLADKYFYVVTATRP